MLSTLLSSKGKKVNKKERVSTIMGLSLLEDTDNYFHDPNKGPLRRRDISPVPGERGRLEYTSRQGSGKKKNDREPG